MRAQFAGLDSIVESALVHLASLRLIVRLPQHSVFVAYPLVPWIGVTAVGYSLGQVYAWTRQRRSTNKYPPSLLFLLMTLGPALVFLWAVDGRTPRLLHPTLTFGRVPLFFFSPHIPFIHLIAVGVCYVRYRHVHRVFESPTMAQFPFLGSVIYELGSSENGSADTISIGVLSNNCH